jgi:UDP-N-acetylglucosamine 2-epimerase (non-hydrolysing)
VRVLLVAGARPNFMKVAPIQRILSRRGVGTVLVHTGQHYDEALSATFFEELGLPDPDFFLGAGSASHAVQTARVMEAFEPVLKEVVPDWVVVVGDVNSTLAAALVTAKLRVDLGCRLAHVEAGLRSGDWRMPEEVNRVLTDRLADLLLLPSRDALPNLLAEGIPEERTAFVGNVMIDTLLQRLGVARERRVPEAWGLEPGGYVLATVHRPSNVDDRGALERVLQGLAAVAEEIPVVAPLHPRTRARIRSHGVEAAAGSARLIDPVGYTEMVGLLDGAAAVVTDSGGVQEETTALGVPCVTLRENTERPVTVTLGTNRLTPWPLTPEGVLASVRAALDAGRVPPGSRCPEGWDGLAAERVVEALVDG